MSFTYCKHISLSLLFITAFTICLTATSQTTGDYRSNAATVSWESVSNWQTWNGTAWVTATTIPNAAIFTNNTITIQSGHTVTFGANYTLTAGNSMSFENTGILDFAGSNANTLTVNGNIRFKGTSATQVRPGDANSGGNNTLTFGAGATIEVANNNGLAGSNCVFLTSYRKLSVTFNAGTTFIFNGGATQALTGLPNTVGTLTVNNSNGVTLPAATTISTGLNLTAGTLNNSTNNITLGNGATITRSGGSLSAVPVFGTAINVVYAQHTGAITTSNELPTTTTVLNNLTINNSNGVNLNAACTVNGTITLTNGLFVLGNNNITSVKATSPISGGSATSYFKTSGTGTIKTPVANATTVTFPVGNSSYNALSITNRTGTADAFAVRVYDAMNTNGTASGTAVSTARVNRTWDITKTNANSGAGVDLVFNWNAGDVVPTLTTPELFHYTNAAGNWIKQTGTKTATSTSLTYTGYTGSFSPFAIADGLFTLPVSFLSFTAQKKEHAIVLNWTTANEQNADTYYIQHSANGSSWNTFGNVKAFGNSTTVSAYSFKHTSPLADKNFYRIYQVDINGQGYYTPVVQISNNKTTAGKILTNPVSNGLLTVQINNSTTIQLYSSDGRMLIEKQCAAGVNSINVSNYSKGMYQLRLGDKLLPFIIQ